jgi:hypothetical protein
MQPPAFDVDSRAGWVFLAYSAWTSWASYLNGPSSISSHWWVVTKARRQRVSCTSTLRPESGLRTTASSLWAVAGEIEGEKGEHLRTLLRSVPADGRRRVSAKYSNGHAAFAMRDDGLHDQMQRRLPKIMVAPRSFEAGQFHLRALRKRKRDHLTSLDDTAIPLRCC